MIQPNAMQQNATQCNKTFKRMKMKEKIKRVPHFFTADDWHIGGEPFLSIKEIDQIS